MKRILISVALFAVILLGETGCVQNNSAQDSSAQNINNVALEYMEQKYGEKFEYVAPWGNSLSGTHELIVSCTSLPGYEIVVQVENYKQADKVFRDNYLAVKYQQETTEFLQRHAEEVFGQAIVLYEPSKDSQSESLSATAAYQEYLADTRTAIMPSIVVKRSCFTDKEQALQLARLISGSGVRYLMSLMVISDADYESGNWSSLGEFLANKYETFTATIGNSNSEIEISWIEAE